MLAESKVDGSPRMEKIPLTSLQPMSIIQVDKFKHCQNNFIALRDQLNTYTFMKEMRSTDTTHILNQIEELQLEFGNIVSDNGSNLVSQEFQDYCRRNEVQHETASLYKPSSNLHAEIRVKKCKYAPQRASITRQSA